MKKLPIWVLLCLLIYSGMNRAVDVIMDVSVSEEFCLWERQQFEIFVTEQECLRVFIEDGIPQSSADG